MNTAIESQPKLKPLQGHRIGLFGRGGCGKSTTTVFLAHALAHAGYPVCVLDADSTNEGLARALGADRAPDSLLEWLGGTVFSGGPVTCPVDDPVPLSGARVSLKDLPPRFFSRASNGSLVFQAGKIAPLGPGAGCDGPMTKIARDFALAGRECETVTLVDFKAGIEDASRGVITSLDWLVVVIDPSHAGVQAAIAMKKLLEQMQSGFMPATQHLKSPDLVKLTEDSYRHAKTKGAVYVLNKVPDAETEHQLGQRLVHAGIQPVASMREDRDLRTAWLNGDPLVSASVSAEVAKIVQALEEGSLRVSGAH